MCHFFPGHPIPVGMIPFFLVPVAQISHPLVLIAGFVLNRIFDILKPFPANRFEQLPDGLGIMADDWIAGIYSCLVLHELLWTGVLNSYAATQPARPNGIAAPQTESPASSWYRVRLSDD